MEAIENTIVFEAPVHTASNDGEVYEPAVANELSCESKIGYSVLCGSCPLVRLLGDCPKSIREQGSSDESLALFETQGEAATVEECTQLTTLDPFVVQEPFELRMSPSDEGTGDNSPALSGEDESESIPIKASVENLTVPSVVARPDAPTVLVAREPLLEPPLRSYRELLFDDAVQVVLAPQFEQQTPAPTAIYVTFEDVAAPVATPAVILEAASESGAALLYEDVQLVHREPVTKALVCVAEQPVEAVDSIIPTAVCEKSTVQEAPALVSTDSPTLELAFTGASRHVADMIPPPVTVADGLFELTDSPLLIKRPVLPNVATATLADKPVIITRPIRVPLRDAEPLRSVLDVSESDTRPSELSHEEISLSISETLPVSFGVDQALPFAELPVNDPVSSQEYDRAVADTMLVACDLPRGELSLETLELEADSDSGSGIALFATPEIVVKATSAARGGSIGHRLRALIGSFAVLRVVAIQSETR